MRSRASARVAALALAGILLAACAPEAAPPAIPVRQAGGLRVIVVDSVHDAGRGASVAIGADGVPAVSYALLKAVLKEGELAPPPVAGQPQPPSVMLATQAEGIWTRTSVTPQPAPGEEAVGSASEIANADDQAIDGVTTSLAIDGQGAHHVVWSTPAGLFYSTDAGGSFSESERISAGPVLGGSIAAGEGGVFVSFYAFGGLLVAERTPERWSIQEVHPDAGPADAPATVTAMGTGPAGQLVAFGDDGNTVVARRAAPGDPWTTETVGPGGFGISMDVDGDGNPHLAYYDREGNVRHAHSIGGGPWDITEIDQVAISGEGSSHSGWSTGIALDDQGVHHITWADTGEQRIEYATNAEDGFAPQPVNSGANGTNPSIAISGDGQKLVLAWFDSANANLEVAETPEGELELAYPTQRPTLPSAPPPTAECEPEGTELQIVAPQGAFESGFDTDCLAAPPGEAFTIAFDNQDAQLHNVAIYTDSSASQDLFMGELIQGPAQTTYNVDALEPGNFFFRCDVHPTTMIGSFIVPEAG